MSLRCKRFLGFSLTAAIVLSSSLTQAQSYGGGPGWSNVPPSGDYDSGQYGWNQRAQPESPVVLLRDGVSKLTRFLDRKPNRGALAAYLDQEVAIWFDFDYMAEWAAGRRANRLDDVELADIAGRLKNSFLQKMAQKLARYSQQRPIFMTPQEDGPGQVTLPVVIENPTGGYPSRLEFRMRQTDKGWKVIDVAANGMSALLYYRETFGEMMRQRQPAMRPY